MAEHYFSEQPIAASAPQQIPFTLGTETLTLTTDRGVFSPNRIDVGSQLLIDRSPALAHTIRATTGDGATTDVQHVLDIGSGYGAISIAAAKRYPEASIFAVDINERSRALAIENAAATGCPNIAVHTPENVPAEKQFDLIVSNPPIRIGKKALHELLTLWLHRLAPNGEAWLVVQKNLGSDSLARWLNEQGFPTSRFTSVDGYRILEVRPHE